MQEKLITSQFFLLFIQTLLYKIFDFNLFIILIDQFISNKFYISLYLSYFSFYYLVTDFSLFNPILIYIQLANILLLFFNEYNSSYWFITQFNYNYILVYSLLYNYCLLYNKKFTPKLFISGLFLTLFSCRNYSILHYIYIYNVCYPLMINI